MRQSRGIMEKVTKVLVKSLIVNILLTLTKFVFGIIYKSKVLVADGIHSLSDLATDVVSIYGSKLSLKPADNEHPYGHGKIEYLTSIVIGAVILALALSLLGNSLNAKNTIASNMVLYVTIFTILAKYLISRYILSKGVKYKSNLLIASGKESRSDVISSAIVIVTYFLSKLSSYSKIFLYSDTIGTFIIGLIILKTAYRILKENIVSILGEIEQDEEYLDKIREIILENSEVVNIEELNIIKYGHYYQANITINMDSDVTLEDAVMNEEIFGPIIPVIKYKNMEDIKYYISHHKNPLALYVFSEDENFFEDIINRFSFGGGCVNDTISHVASAYLPFGGIGSSGMGNYHGKASFDTFTHTKSIVKKSTKIDLKLVFPPYKDKIKLIKKVMK